MADPQVAGPRRLRVFLCHASGDKAAVRELYRRLQQDGYEPWLDEENLTAGDNWKVEIPKAVRAADVVLVCLSAAAINKEGYVQVEIKFALDVANEKPDGTIYLIPLKLEECPVPERLSAWHWVNFFEVSGYERLQRALRVRAQSLGVVTSVPAGTVKVNPKDGLEYVWIPAGRFTMGCSPGDDECWDREKPAHEVEITKGFWMGRTPVTVGAWRRYRRETGAAALPDEDRFGKFNEAAGDDRLPVVAVTWDEAREYALWAGMRLPTEAEWEYAARAGSRRARYGDLEAIAWYADNSGKARIDAISLWDREKGKYDARLFANGNGPRPVRQKGANAWGLHDMLGNVWEWASDFYGPYDAAQREDPGGPASGDSHVVRGGSWYGDSRNVRVSCRRRLFAQDRLNGIGFRCAGELP